MPSANPRYQSPRSAYLHVPFCRHRCGYCNFTLIAGRDDLIERYLLAIDRELQQIQQPLLLETLYFGGGTPTHLTPEQLQQLTAITRRRFTLTAGHEFTVEGNPLDIDHHRLEVLVASGVNRLSLGVQSFSPRKLELLERDHRLSEIRAAYELATSYELSRSIDLIFGVPGETIEEWSEDLRAAIALRPDHVSVYGLTWEQGTGFWSRMRKGQLSQCNDELERSLYERAIDDLAEAGYEHYEVSNFALPGHRSRHNEAYWTGQSYFAAGPGAARYLGGRREMNHRSTTTYIQRILAGGSAIAESECLSDEDSARERFVFALRRLDGIDPSVFQEETGFEVGNLFSAAIARFTQLGFLRVNASRIQLTREGLLISDSLWPYFLRV